MESVCSIVQKVGMVRAIAESESQFRNLIEGAPDAVFVQTDNRFAFVNAAVCRLFGAGSPRDLIGQPVMERFRADYHPIIEGRIRGLNERGQAQDLLAHICGAK
jgi:PAS domain S-box-containing protein